jgi:uncharacterized protein (TIGR03067 family)
MCRLAGAVLFAAIAVPAVAQDEAAEAAKKLEGTYEVTELLIGGKPSEKAKDVSSVVIKDGTITVKVGGRDEPAKFALDPSRKPAHFNIIPGKDDIKEIPGIYETKETDKGLELTIAFARGGKGDRPRDFKGEGANETVMKLIRKKGN